MNRRPLHYISQEKEQNLIKRLIFLVDNSEFDPSNTAIIMASPDYSATVAMHLAHAWSKKGEIIPIIPVHVPYPDEDKEYYVQKLRHDFLWYNQHDIERLVLVEAGVIRGSNWRWLIDEFTDMNYDPSNITTVAMVENTHSTVKSDYVAEYYNNDKHELAFYFEQYNKHWPIF